MNDRTKVYQVLARETDFTTPASLNVTAGPRARLSSRRSRTPSVRPEHGGPATTVMAEHTTVKRDQPR